MASVSQWEVVGKLKPKKTKPGSQNLSKTQKKQLIDKMPRIEAFAPVKEDKTMFSAFLEKEQQQSEKIAANNRQTNGPSSSNNIKKPVVPKKKKPEQDNKKHDKLIPLDTAFSQVDHKELENILGMSKARFPENQDIWLKDLASWLNVKLEKVKDSDNSFTFKGKPSGYPFEALPQGSQKVLNSVVKKFSNQSLDNLFDYCIQMMLDQSKDLSTMGFRIFLQLLAHHKPEIVLGKIPQYLELLKTHQNRPSHCLSILWAVGQCGIKNLKSGLKVWLDLMLPALEIRQVAHYPVEYLEQLLGSQKKVSNAYGIVTTREYFQILDIVFSPSFNLSGELRKRLMALYPHIKELAFGEAPSQSLRLFFPSYLARFNPALNPALKTELLDSMVTCLTTDKQSFSVWCQLYTKHLTASGHVLEHINHEWSKLAPLFDKKLLRETVRSFSVTNDELETQGRSNKDGLGLCQAATKELTGKMTKSSFPWGLFIFFLVSVVASIVVFDIWSSPNLQSSKTMRFLEHYGILAVLQQAWGRVHTFITLAADWIKVNFPVYYSYVRDTVGPFLANTWIVIKDTLVAAELTTRPHRAWVVDKSVSFSHWVYELSPETWTWCYEVSLLAWDVIKDYTLWIWKHSVHLSQEFWHWVTEHLLVGNISKDSLKATANWSISQVQTSFEVFWAWCHANVFTFVK